MRGFYVGDLHRPGGVNDGLRLAANQTAVAGKFWIGCNVFAFVRRHTGPDLLGSAACLAKSGLPDRNVQQRSCGRAQKLSARGRIASADGNSRGVRAGHAGRLGQPWLCHRAARPLSLKKSNNSASLGVGVLGSVSLPFTSSSDAMVKIASETISSESFYDRFFDLVRRYLVLSEMP